LDKSIVCSIELSGIIKGLHLAIVRLPQTSELRAEDDASSNLCDHPSPQKLRWRAWPCPKCRGRITPIGHLLASIGAGEVVSSGSPEEIAMSQIAALRKWIGSCAHYAHSVFTF